MKYILGLMLFASGLAHCAPFPSALRFTHGRSGRGIVAGNRHFLGAAPGSLSLWPGRNLDHLIRGFWINLVSLLTVWARSTGACSRPSQCLPSNVPQRRTNRRKVGYPRYSSVEVARRGLCCWDASLLDRRLGLALYSSAVVASFRWRHRSS